MHKHDTSIGLDVHARSISACAFDPITGEVTRAFWRWVDGISMPEADAASALEHYRDAVKRCQEAKAALEAKVAEAAGGPEWAAESDALSLIKGIDTVAAFALAWEAGDFSRFPSAPSFAAWTGLVPSESSSGESSSRGGITRTGNAHVRALPVEAAWHVPMSSRKPKPERPGHEVPAPVGRHALKCNRRLQDRREAMSSSGKRPCVANCATVREMACWVWAIGRMARPSWDPVRGPPGSRPLGAIPDLFWAPRGACPPPRLPTWREDPSRSNEMRF